MKIYSIFLDESYPDDAFVTDWDIDLIGDTLREEFNEHIEKLKKEVGAVTGGTKQILVGEELKRFMVRKQINMVVPKEIHAMPQSKFILKKGEEKTIDERAWNSLKRFAYSKTILENGVSQINGYIHYKIIGGEETEKKIETTGPDVTYFPEASVEKKEPVEAETFTCQNCGKTFNTKRQLTAHTNFKCKK